MISLYISWPYWSSLPATVVITEVDLLVLLVLLLLTGLVILTLRILKLRRLHDHLAGS